MQKYNNFSSSDNSGRINGYLLVKLNAASLECLTKIGISADDYKFIPLYEEYRSMRAEGLKYDYVVAKLAEQYNISISTVKRIIRRFERMVEM